MLRTDELDYQLPAGMIATEPISPRDAARLMVVHDRGAGAVEHRRVSDLPELLLAGDRLVFNTTRVLPARFVGVREDTGGKVGGLFLKQLGHGRWLAMVKARRFRPGAPIRLFDAAGHRTGVVLSLIERPSEDESAWVVAVRDEGGPIASERTPAVLQRVGLTPLPPYILAARRDCGLTRPDAQDRASYQTVYAGEREAGSVAAPTAGLHFTPELLTRLVQRGIERSDTLLHVGAATFKPIETEHVEEHPMHAEWCSMTGDAAGAIRQTRTRGGRVIAVGTTAVRTLESYAPHMEGELPPWIQTRLLIAPGYRWQVVDGLLTNFHLPRSTLLALVAAMVQGGPARVRELYALAMDERYRFYSYGDAMLILPDRRERR